ncbi:1,3-beta-glucan synthase [Neoconidiobolus thromboides FSU 785]|nr:1,3-beta-glucan synthase [Neoconidiobolus thromboides FSU 785]
MFPLDLEIEEQSKQRSNNQIEEEDDDVFEIEENPLESTYVQEEYEQPMQVRRIINSENNSDDSTNSSQLNARLRAHTPLSGVSADFDLNRSLNFGTIDEGRYFQYAPSSESLLAKLENRKFTRTGSGSLSKSNSWNGGLSSYPTLPGVEPTDPDNDPSFPAWSLEKGAPLSSEDIYGVFVLLRSRFGFQLDNLENTYEAMMTMLDSRASRMPPTLALTTLHADYIGGEYANYRKWLFCTQLHQDGYEPLVNETEEEENNDKQTKARNEAKIRSRWRRRMDKLAPEKKVLQIALYLLIWGEGLTLRYSPECLCFIFKICLDATNELNPESQYQVNEGEFLRKVVTPLYQFVRDQSFEKINGKYFKRERDHANIIGYDDVNELFWSKSGIERIILEDKTKLIDLPYDQRFENIEKVVWKKAFYKTYKERRTCLHLLTNFNRIWVFHFVMFYYYLFANATFIYEYYTEDPKKPDPDDIPMRLSVTALGGGLGCLITIFSSICELFFIPSSTKNIRKISFRIFCLFCLAVLCIGPIFYIALVNRRNTIALILSIVQLIISVIVTCIISITPSASLFVYNGKREENGGDSGLTNRSFTANFPELKWQDRFVSISMWSLIFICKLIESYLFLALSFKDPFRSMAEVDLSDCSDALLGDMVCKHMGYVILAIMTFLDLILFFLDTYFWYIVWNSIFSVALSFYLGISILSPWKNIFSRLPKRIHAKILASGEMEIKYKPKFLTSQIWNSIIVSMYRDHLLSIDHLQRLLFQQVAGEQEGKRTLKPPTFFVAQEDQSLNAEFYPPGSEADRRISFFAQSLSTVLPEPVSVERMPSFTVLTPHYSEKILLTLREIIREEDRQTRVTLLEYLKSLHSFEWMNFINDTKVLEEENTVYTDEDPPSSIRSFSGYSADEKSEIDDLPLYYVGFKSASPEYVLRTRIWASLRSQTLYRTISGFMNYARAIKALYRVENPDMVKLYSGHGNMLERKIDIMVRRKFRFLISMQRYCSFTAAEKEDVEFLLKAYPDLQIAYLLEITRETEDGPEVQYFSCLIDGHCEKLEDGSRKPRYMIELPGHPILGDGKADNQNHSIIFTRGEYIQLIDANQDNYLEEAMKIRNILAEFEGFEVDSSISPYSGHAKDHYKPPVAIVGAREYIFSENIGVLGDVAAGKEQTFGTMTQRIMAKIGGKLHYGHPDFLNSIFMNTRGGVSKAQKGLHLNEDIYAGMNAFQRGGRIKHIEYYQCGKGRDLGFSSILSFNTKIGTGMGEQILSREQYYLGTQLPLDRFLTFYYAHPGFHVNNVMITIATQLLMVVLLGLGSLYVTNENICEQNEDLTAAPKPTGCFNVWPILSWIVATIISIFIVFAISYLPFFLQVFSEQGFTRTLLRLGKHFLSFSPVFEIFANQIYSASLLSNLSYGGATYIATGRGFATTRTSFANLYSRFAASSIYSGVRIFFMILFASINIWVPHYIYFWIMALSLCIAPFLFNPHEFSPVDFILDYRDFIKWLSAGNSTQTKYSWVTHCRILRTKVTGYKRRKLGQVDHSAPTPRANKWALIFPQVIFPILSAVVMVAIYSYLGSMTGRKHAIFRVGAAALGPIALNAAVLLVLFFVSLLMGPIVNMCFKPFGNIIAGIAHGWSVLVVIIFFLLLLMLENWELPSAILGMIASVFVQRAIFQIIESLLLTRETSNEACNVAWWTGRWGSQGLGFMALTQPLREFLCKIIEMSYFATDFITGHFIMIVLFPVTLVPLIDRWHSAMLFWLRPSQQIPAPIYSVKQIKKRRRRYIGYLILFILVEVILLAVLIVPALIGSKIGFKPSSISFLKDYLI